MNEPSVILDAPAAGAASQSSPSVLAMFAGQCRSDPGRVAVEYAGRTMSYAELDAASTAVALALAAHGTTRGERVGVCLPRSEQMLVAVLGVMKAGAAYVPLDPTFPLERLEYMANHARLSRIVAWQANAVPASVAEGRDVLQLDGLARDQPPVELPAAGPEDVAYVLYTSGSTGKPKGVCILHRNLANFLVSMRREPGVSAQDAICAITTLSFDIAGLELYLPLVCGARVVVASDEEARDPDALLQLLVAHRVSVLQSTPALMRALLDRDASHVLRQVRVLVGGEELPRDLANALLPASKAVWNMYGPTETTIWSTLAPITARLDGPAPLGHPIDATVVHLLDERRQPTPDGEIGEIWIGGAGVTAGYLFQPGLTAERFVDDPFVGGGGRMYRTGDLGSRRDDELYFHGRVDNQVKLRGFRIELGEIEAAAREVDGVLDAVASTCDFTPTDRRLVVYAVARTQDPTLDERLRAGLRDKLPHYMLPQLIEWLTALPQTPNGKIDRKALPLPAAAAVARTMRAAVPAETVAPMDSREAQLAAIWRELIGVDDVRPEDNFFDLGGHSLLAVEMVSRVQGETGARLKLIDIATSSLAALARELPATGQPANVGWSARLRRLFGMTH